MALGVSEAKKKDEIGDGFLLDSGDFVFPAAGTAHFRQQEERDKKLHLIGK